MKIKTLFIAVSFLCNFALLSGQVMSTDSVRFLNTGALNVSADGVVFIQGDMQTDDPAGLPADSIAVVMVNDGSIFLTGSFFHDATGNAFNTRNNDWSDRDIARGIPASLGYIGFVGNSFGGRRFIASSDLLAFDRVADYIAFPNLEISTNDTIFVLPTMGFDVSSIYRPFNTVADTTYLGVLYLQSNLVDRGVDQYIYTASLRVTPGPSGFSDFPVATDAVIVEQRVQEFRATGASGDTGAATMLFPFASPFEDMRSGVFAGNWVRRPLIDEAANSFRFPYGNQSSANDAAVICRSQYVVDPLEELSSATAHLIRLRRLGAHYNDGSIPLMPGADRDVVERATFVFGTGAPWEFMREEDPNHSDGPLFVGRDLLEQRVVPNLPRTQNWLVGNSFTSGISGQAIADYLMTGGLGAFFAPELFIFHHGATSYQTYPIWEWDSPGATTGAVPQNIPDIQAMGIFMMAAWRDNTNSPYVNIGHRFQVHTAGIPSTANPGSGIQVLPPPVERRTTRSLRSFDNSTLNFVLTPEENPFIFSRTSVRLNANADVNSDSHNVLALRNASNHLFHLYGTNLSREMLQQNVLPYTAPLAMLSVSPAAESMAVVLRVEGAENFATEVVELYDRQTGHRQDLRANNSYWFVMHPGDNADRFEVHFVSRVSTDLVNNPFADDWQAFSFGGELVITDLSPSHHGAQMRIHNASGMLHIQQPVATVPEERINISSLPAGVYLLSIEGRTVKFIR